MILYLFYYINIIIVKQCSLFRKQYYNFNLIVVRFFCKYLFQIFQFCIVNKKYNQRNFCCKSKKKIKIDNNKMHISKKNQNIDKKMKKFA